MAAMSLKYVAARAYLRAGKVIAYPTEGVWGIGCDPFNRRAVERLLAIKQRPVDKGLILVAASIEQVEPFLRGLSAQQRQTLESSWPGPVTWLVPDNGYAPDWIRGDHNAVALRISQHPTVTAICNSVGGPIVSTSANRSGRPVARHPWQVRERLPEIDFIVHGSLGGAGKPSQIRDLVSGEVIRGA